MGKMDWIFISGTQLMTSLCRFIQAFVFVCFLVFYSGPSGTLPVLPMASPSLLGTNACTAVYNRPVMKDHLLLLPGLPGGCLRFL